ncbi:cilia- and flagella-associated protein 221 [Betta splendens]|uniref:Cilia- and flagella-associated protein 221 n=1 Tax=Betta splendens TaxID=158456 RepID=A0A6P7P089_BETSP|nr:cilia- and flagella-associated protein 221 [Betta splendens]
MEVVQAGPQILPAPQRRGTPLPLSQLVEESRSRASIPNHLLTSKIYAKLKSNGLIQAEPPELHFSGFALEKDYTKILNLINISSEVMNIHIIPTQTKHFQTTYTKKYRLLPGLAYTLKVRFSPDEWRYFYDCIRIHCQGDENLLIPVHAYPVIDDLHIPSHIHLSAVPLGQSVTHAIPLRCSSPIDFEFQVYVIQPHEAFSIHPLAGVIPANDEVKIMVTFSPSQYETCQVTIQLVVSQFNTQPYLCTITGSSTPYLNISQLEKKLGRGDAASAECKGPSSATQVLHRRKTKSKSNEHADNSKILKDQCGLKALVNVCTPAGVAKMLIRDTSKITSKDLREAMSCANVSGVQTKQMKEALFKKKVQQNVKEVQANHSIWQIDIGKDPMSGEARRHIAEEREIALHEYMARREDVRKQENIINGQPKLFSTRLLFKAGQPPEGSPSFQFYSSFQWELKQRALKLFQQAARKVVIQCRMSHRLASLKKLADHLKNPPSALKDEIMLDLKITPERIFPFSFPVFPDEDEPLAHHGLATVPMDPINLIVTTKIPLFKLHVPQHYKLMGYQPVSTWEAFNSYIPSSLARPLQSGALEELVLDEAEVQARTSLGSQIQQEQQPGNNEERVIAKLTAGLTFSAPEPLLRPFPANPLRIFNPAPGLQAYKPTPKYLECDPEFYLCPLPRYTIPERSMMPQMPLAHNKPLDCKEAFKGVMLWKDFGSVALKCLSKQPALNSDCAPSRSVNYSTDILPLSAPPPLTALPDDMSSLMDQPCEAPRVRLTPEMIRAEFLTGEALVSNSSTGVTARHLREHQMEETYRSEVNQMAKGVMSRLKQLGVTDWTLSGENRQNTALIS